MKEVLVSLRVEAVMVVVVVWVADHGCLSPDADTLAAAWVLEVGHEVGGQLGQVLFLGSLVDALLVEAVLGSSAEVVLGRSEAQVQGVCRCVLTHQVLW